MKQKGGWIKVKGLTHLINTKERQNIITLFTQYIKEFNFSKFMEKNSPNNELMYVYTAVFCFISLYGNITTIDHDTKLRFPQLFQFVTPSVLFSATALLSYPLWSDSWKAREVIAHMVWNIVAFYGLICIGFLFTMLSGFNPLQVMLLTLSIIIVAMLVKWQWALSITISGILFTFFSTRYYFPTILSLSGLSIKLQIIYLLVLTSGLLVMFIKPKQEQETLLTSRVNYLRRKILAKEEDMMRALSLSKVENNNHKPLNNVIFISQMLFDFYDNLNGSEKQEAARIILKSFMRLENFESNIANLSKLATLDFDLNQEEIDLTTLINTRLRVCRNLYEENDSKREFVVNIKENVKINGNKSYLEQMIDNLIINAIINCPKGIININLERFGSNSLSFCIKIS